MAATVTDAQVKKGHALPAPGQDRPGRFPVENEDDLKKAIKAVGRAKGGSKGRAIVRRYLIKRAKALKLEHLIPDNWNPDGSLKDA